MTHSLRNWRKEKASNEEDITSQQGQWNMDYVKNSNQQQHHKHSSWQEG